MSVYRKLQVVRIEMARANLKKSGKNKFAGFEYFELGDFLPKAHELMDAVGICGVFSIGPEFTSLTVFDVDPSGGAIQFTSPTVMAENSKGQPIQSLGATHTYMRRYMWLIALELSEHDEVDAIAAPEPKAKHKAEPKLEPVVAELPKAAPAVIEGKGGAWNLKITSDPGSNVLDWIESVFQAVKFTLELVQSESDVMTVFRTNKAIFDRLQLESEEKHKELMSVFKTHREKFKESK